MIWQYILIKMFRVPLAWNSSQHTRFPSCLTTFRHLLQLWDTKLESWKEIWEIPASMILLNLPRSAASSCWRPSVWSCARKASKKSLSFSRLMWHHGFSMDLICIWYYLIIFRWNSRSFRVSLHVQAAHQIIKPDTPAISHTPSLCLPKRFVAKAKAHATLLSKVPQAPKDSVAPLNRNVNGHGATALELTGCHSDCKKPKPSWHQLDSIAPGFSATLQEQTQIRKWLCAFDCVKQLRGISMADQKDASCKKVKR